MMLTATKLKKPQTIIHALLHQLNVPFTSKHLNETISLHPNAGNMLGVSDILYQYNIENISLKINKEDLFKIEPPFLAQLHTNKKEFGLVTGLNNNVTYTSEKGIKTSLSKEEFFKKWTGIVLLSETSTQSREKDYLLNRRKQLFTQLRLPLIAIIFLCILSWFLYVNRFNIPIDPFGYSALILLYLTATVINILLLMQTIDKNNPFINKICGLAKINGNCNNVLEGPAARLFGIISWSEIGFCFFAGNLLSLIIAPEAIAILFWLNLFALPYTLWSIYHQWKIAKQWCILCISVQVLLWLIFLTYAVSNATLNLNDIAINAFIKALLCFLLPASALWFVLPYVKKAHLLLPAMQELNSLKANETIFEAALKKQKKVEINGLNKSIAFGNAHALFVVTIVTNPFCGPCAVMHEKLEKLLAQYRDYIQLQIIYAVSNIEEDERNKAIKQLIAAYFEYGADKTEEIYNYWYKTGKTNIENFIKQFSANAEAEVAQKIVEVHKEWCTNNSVTATPAIYVNGYELPNWYKAEDLKYFIK